MLASIHPARHRNRDRTPYLSATGARHTVEEHRQRPAGELAYAPRREFDPVAPVHQFSRILDDFREFHGDAHEWLLYLHAPAEQQANGEDWTAEEVAHAITVLTRYQAVYTDGTAL